jgi:AcrR family transcriptional regulator
MPRLKPEIQRARRDHILDAAERCFARAGFHRTTIQDICKQAGVSPGALYTYFDSKEALIAGIAERDRAEFAERLAGVAAAPDFLAALKELGEHYFGCGTKPSHLMCIEIGLESTRNPRIAEIHRSVDKFVSSSIERLFRRLQDEGRIAPELEIPVVVNLFSVIADGMFWRRAVDPAFDGAVMVPASFQLLVGLLKPVPQQPTPSPQHDAETQDRPLGRPFEQGLI